MDCCWYHNITNFIEYEEEIMSEEDIIRKIEEDYEKWIDDGDEIE